MTKTKGARMVRNIKFFALSGASLDFREIRFFKIKVLGSGLLLAVVSVGIMLLANYLSGDLLGLGYDRMAMLSNENRILKEQLRDLSGKIASSQRALESLSERGNELRLMVDLQRIDDDRRSASIGGSQGVSTSVFLTGEAGAILSESRTLIDRLSREVKLQQASYEEIYKRMEFNRGFFSRLPAIKPMRGYYSINGFGMRIHPILGVYRMHDGIDIINDVGTGIYASADGVVRFAGHTAAGYGIALELSHGYGYSTFYAHLSKVLVRSGQTVRRGELIAKCGRSGLTSGPHLHYEVRYNGRKVNPADYFFDDVDAARYRALVASSKTPKGEI